MGKGQIISGGTDGLYQVQLKYNRERYAAVVAAMDAKKTALQEKREPIQTDRDAKAIEVESKRAEVSGLISTYESLTSTLSTRQQELTTLENQLTVLEQQLSDLQDESNTLQLSINTLQTELEETDDPEEQSIIQEQIDAFQIEFNITDNSITNKQNEIDAKQTEIENKQTQIDDLKSDIADNMDDQTAAFKELNTLNIDLQRLDAQLANIDLSITAIDRRRATLAEKIPVDRTVSAWCADLTTNLSGEVGTIEIPGEIGIVQIQPGYVADTDEDQLDAGYNSDRDGQLFPTIAMTSAQAFYNLAMLPGWQMWMPKFRHGTITSLSEDSAGVTLDDSVKSSQQSLDINHRPTLSDVPIEYMTCDGAAFSVDDDVLVSFSPTAAMVARFSGYNTLRTELGVLVRDLAKLKARRQALTTDMLILAKAVLQQELSDLYDDLAELQKEEPPDAGAIAAKQAEINAKIAEIDAKDAEIYDQEELIQAKEDEIEAKQDEILAKKAEIKTKVDEIKANITDLAKPKIIGFKTNPKPCTMIIPYLYASETNFPAAGLLLCNGGAVSPDFATIEDGNFQFLADYELFSPYGDTSYIVNQRYTWYSYDGQVLEFQVKEYTDESGTMWNEIPWMGSGTTWDPVYYTQYDGWYNEGLKPYRFYWGFSGDKNDDQPGEYPYAYSQTKQLAFAAYSDGSYSDIEIIESCLFRRWYDSASDTWHEEADMYSIIMDAIDQADPDKRCLIYSKYSRQCSLDFYANNICDDANADVVTSATEYKFVGLGFNQTLTIPAGTCGGGDMRLYEVNGTHICLFKYGCLLGVAIEGVGLTLTDVSGGVFYDGEYTPVNGATGSIGLLVKGYIPEP